MEIILPDGSTLMHGSQPYDPVKAREYYLRTRKLKGRKKGRKNRPKRSFRTRKPTYTIKGTDGKEVRLTAQQLAEQKAYAAYRVGKLKKKISLLAKELRERMAEARKREAEAKKPDSAAEKAEKARESEKYRDKHQAEIAAKAKSSSSSNSSKSKEDTVEGLKTQIAGAKKSLKDAVAKQRSLATAKKNG